MSYSGKKLKIQWLIYHVLPFSTTKNNHGFFEHIVAGIERNEFCVGRFSKSVSSVDTLMPADRLYDEQKATNAWINMFVRDTVVDMDAI